MTVRPAKCLIIEDNLEVLNILTNEFRKAGVSSITTCTDGAEGLSVLSENNFDVILVDYTIPPPNGLQLIAAIATDSKNFKSRKYIMTGESIETIKKDAGFLRLNGFFQKPFNPTTVVEEILFKHTENNKLPQKANKLLECFCKALTLEFTKLDPNFRIIEQNAKNYSITDKHIYRSLIQYFGSESFGSIALNFSKVAFIKIFYQNVEQNIHFDINLAHDSICELNNSLMGEYKRQVLKSFPEFKLKIGIPYPDKENILPHPIPAAVHTIVGELRGSIMLAEICLGDFE